MSDAAPQVSLLKQWLSPLRSLIDPKFVWSMVMVAAVGAGLGYTMFKNVFTGAVFMLSIVGLTYVARTFAWPQLNVGELVAKAKDSAIGCSIMVFGLMFWCAVVMLAMSSKAQAEAIPPAAWQHLPTLRAEAREHWAAPVAAPLPTIAGLIDHETACPRAATCWQTTAMYKTAREEGRGLGMFTRAFTANGKLRFDAFGELKALHPSALRDATWEMHKTDPQLQARAVVLKVSDNMSTAVDLTPYPQEQLAFAITMHNRGVQGVLNEVAACAMTRGCDRTRWRGNVERTCTASRSIIPGTGRSACDISRAYAPDVMRRAAKYAGVV